MQTANQDELKLAYDPPAVNGDLAVMVMFHGNRNVGQLTGRPATFIHDYLTNLQRENAELRDELVRVRNILKESSDSADLSNLQSAAFAVFCSIQADSIDQALQPREGK